MGTNEIYIQFVGAPARTAGWRANSGPPGLPDSPTQNHEENPQYFIWRFELTTSTTLKHVNRERERMETNWRNNSLFWYYVLRKAAERRRSHDAILESLKQTTEEGVGFAMAGDTDTRSWADLLHNSTQLLQSATPSAQFPPIQVRPQT